MGIEIFIISGILVATAITQVGLLILLLLVGRRLGALVRGAGSVFGVGSESPDGLGVGQLAPASVVAGCVCVRLV